jgi:hypothetical protein
MAPHDSGNLDTATAPGNSAPSASGGTCATPPCSAALLGDVGFTTVSGKEPQSGQTFAAGENIYGPFEAGFSAQQADILAGLGCATGRGYVPGGIDTQLAELVVAYDCGVELPREENGKYIALLDRCGGHTIEYHFHQQMNCLYENVGGHSAQVGKALDMQPIYGKYENYATGELPLLDACGGHFGITPDSGTTVVYHYHVQDKAPHTIGCFGPAVAADGTSFSLVTLAQCRSLYPGCGDGDTITLSTAGGSVLYDPWCPCYDELGFNSDVSKERSVFSSQKQISCSGAACTGFTPVSASDGAVPGVNNGAFPLAMLLGGAIGAICVGGCCVALTCLCAGSASRKRGLYTRQTEDESTGDEL